MTRREKIIKILEILENYEEIRIAPVFEFEKLNLTPFQILIGTILSTRTRDEITLRVIKSLFSRYSTPEEISKLSLEEIQELIKSIGFYRSKAKYILEVSKIISQEGFPTTYEKLISLPGVGRKVANIAYSIIYQKNLIGVDVHVHRISNRLGIVKTKTPFETEKELEKIVPEQYKKKINRYFVALGQTVCKARPKCSICKLNFLCKSYKYQKSKI